LIKNSDQAVQEASLIAKSPIDILGLTAGIEKGFQVARDILDSELKDIRQDTEATVDTPSGKLSRVTRTTKKTITTVTKKKQPPTKDGKIKAKVTKPVAPKVKPKSITTLDIYEVPLSSSPPPAPAIVEDVVPSHHCSTLHDDTTVSTPPPALDENATVRRIWTPVKDSTIIDLSLDSPESKPQFNNALDGFRFTSVETSSSSIQLIQEGQPTTKRRCLEVIDLPSVAASLNASRGQASVAKPEGSAKGKKVTKVEKPVKTPKIKKKPRTITDIAMAPYQPAAPEPEPPSTIVQYLESSEEIVEAATKSTRKPRKSTGTQAKSGKRKEPSPECLLLSPASAQKTLRQQSFVFGTSSQLITESHDEDLVQLSNGRFNNKLSRCSTSFEDTVEILGLTEDQVVTEKHYEVTPTQPDEVIPETTEESQKSSLEILGKTESVAKGNLWSVASRGLSGEVLKAHMIDMVDDDIPAREVLDLIDDVATDTLMTAMNTAKDLTSIKDHETTNNAPLLGPETIDVVEDRPLETLANNAPCAKAAIVPTTNASKISSIISAATAPPHPAGSSNTEVVPPRLAPVKPKPRGKATKSHIKELDEYTTADRPDFETYTIIQLQAQVDKYGFKPMKTRKAMLGLLDRCWDDVLERARTARGENVDVESATAAPIEPISAIIQIADDASDDDESDQPLINTVAQRKKITADPQNKGLAGTSEAEPQQVKAKRKYTKKKISTTAEEVLQSVSNNITDDTVVIGEESTRATTRISVDVVSPRKQKSADNSTTTTTKTTNLSHNGILPPPSKVQDHATSVATISSLINHSSSSLLSKPTFPPLTIQSLAASTTSQLDQRITKFITSQPPSEDLENPSIYQRILMYEPIIIEELASWLWEQGCWGDVVGDDVEDSSDEDDLPLFFLRGGGDGNTDVVDVDNDDGGKEKKGKEKAKSKKQKQTNKKKKKNKGAMVEVDPKIIRAVQEWCEKQSIVWVKKESLNGGSRNRY